jgi:tetratricopeptide (TPR) repeat protein
VRATAIFISQFSLGILILILIVGMIDNRRKKRSSNLTQNDPGISVDKSQQHNRFPVFFPPTGLFLGSLAVYLKTLCPSVYGWDSGEILSAIAAFGIAQPVGFPLYILAGKFFSLLLPFGDAAFKVNSLSAVFASLSVVMIYYILKTLTDKKSISFAGAFCFAFSTTLWSQATVASAHIMACFFMTLAIYLIVLWSLDHKDKYLYFFAITLGLGSGTHAMMLLTIPMALAMIMMTDVKALLRPAALKAVSLAVAIAALLYLYIPFTALINSVDTDKFAYYTHGEYNFEIAASTTRSVLRAFFLTIKLFLLEFTPLGFIVILYGAFGSGGKYKKIFITFAIIVASNIFFIISHGEIGQDISILSRYLFPSYIVMSIGAGLGLHSIYIFLKVRLKHPLLPSLVLSMLPLLCLITHYHQSDRSKNFIPLDYASNILDTPPPHSILFTTGDFLSGSIQYLQIVNGDQDDLIPIDRDLLSQDQYCQYLLKRYPNITPNDILSVPPEKRFFHFIDDYISKQPIFTTFLIPEQYENIPYGLVYRILPKGASLEFEKVKEANDALWQHYTQRGLLDARVSKDHMLKEIVDAYGRSKSNLGLYYSSHDRVEEAIEEYETSLKYNPDNFASLFNLGQLYMQSNKPEKGRALLAKATERDPDFFLRQDSSAEANQTSNDTILLSQPTAEAGADTAQYHEQIGIQFGTVGNHQKAVEEFKRALEFQPNDASLRILLGTAYMNSQAADAAIDNYKKAIAIDPGAKSATAYLNLGAIYANEKSDYPTSLIYLEKYVEVAPNNPDVDRIKTQIGQIKSILQSAKPSLEPAK